MAAQLLLAQGVGVKEAAKRSDLGRTTLSRLLHGADEEAQGFQAELTQLRERIADEAIQDVVAQAVKDLRDLAPEVIEAFRKGLAAEVRYTALKGEDGALVVPLPDVSLAVRTADIVSKRIAELVPQEKSQIEHTGSIEHLIAELDGRADG